MSDLREGGERLRRGPKRSEPGLPLISIATVTINAAKHLPRLIMSIRAQRYPNIEWLVIDGGSTDATLDLLKANDDTIDYWRSEPDKGIYDAINKACSLATGDWLIFLGCDDVLLDTLECSAKLMIDPGAAYYGDVIFRSSGKIYGGKSSKLRLMEYNICHQALFYPKSVYRKYTYDLKYRWHADYLYNLTIMGAGIPFIYTGIVISVFNDKGGSLVGDADFQNDQLKLIAATLGSVYAWVESARRFIRTILKLLVPSPVWKYFRSLYGSKKGS